MSLESIRQGVHRSCTLLLPFFVLLEVNYPHLAPQSQLAIFAGLGLALCFLTDSPRSNTTRIGKLILALLALLVCGYMVVQTEPNFSGWWLDGQTLGGRAGAEQPFDFLVGSLGLLLVLVAARKSVGWALPILSLVFLGYAYFGAAFPDWLLPHRGYGLERIVSQNFLHNQGVFGIALRVMFSYVFLFVVFGALLEATGATRYIIDLTRHLFRRTSGGPAKVAVLSSGLMGSLSGSAVANTATTGTFTIPMMRSAGFPAHTAAGLEAAASSGGALVPPVMGAGAYMMLEIIDPPVSYLQIIRAALIPAILYYLSLFLIVHFRAQRLEVGGEKSDTTSSIELTRYEGLVFLSGLIGLVGFLVAGYSVFRAVTLAIAVVLVVSAFHRRTRLSVAKLGRSLIQASRNAVPLIAAAACVGIIIGVVTLTGIGSRLPALIVALAEGNLLGALLAIMVSSIILGMGLPSAVCYLLMATLIGPALGHLGVVLLAAHLFIFYFGMMSMVTPPVALAAYTASSIAGSGFFRSSVAAFRFALIGFVLPFLFVYRPELLMLDPGGGSARPGAVVVAAILVLLGVVPLAAASAGYLRGPLAPVPRVVLFVAAALLLFPDNQLWPLGAGISGFNLLGLLLVAGVLIGQRRVRRT